MEENGGALGILGDSVKQRPIGVARLQQHAAAGDERAGEPALDDQGVVGSSEKSRSAGSDRPSRDARPAAE